jgi:rare lipoprotein A
MTFLFSTGCFHKLEDNFQYNGNYIDNLPEGNYSFYQSGIASWYGKKFHGRPTASGEIFNMYEISAAHKTLPLGSYILVVNKKNGKKIKVKVNDRGPFVKGRVLDLSYAAAKKLGYSEEGLAEVDIFVFGEIESKNCFSVQFGAFGSKERARRFAKKVGEKIGKKVYVAKEGDLFKVLCGEFQTKSEAEKFRKKNKKISEGFVVACK